MVIALALALAVVLVLMVFWRQYLGELMQLAGLIGAVLLMIWLQDNGYLDGNGRDSGPGGRLAPTMQPR